MNMNSNTLFIILSTCIVAAGAFWYFYTNNVNKQPLTASTVNNEEQMQFQRLVNELPVRFDPSIFSNPQFLALSDLTTTITKEPIGRTDPFAPVVGVRSDQ